MDKRIIAFDIGDRRIGVAVSDPFNSFALPGETYFRTGTAEKDAAALAAIAKEKDAGLIVCGLPLNADGSDSVQTEKTRRFVRLLERNTNLPVVFEDERFTSIEAERDLITGGVRREKRKKSIDSIAASYILESYLNKVPKNNREENFMEDDELDLEEFDDDDVNLVELIDEEGKTHRCYHLATFEYKEKWYATFQSAEDDEDDSVTILEIVEDGDEEQLLPVEDDSLLDEVFDEFCRIMEEDEDADEAASLDTDYEEGIGSGVKNHNHRDAEE